nr:immunoglobulin heavy chain junction region [Macaca mulatta]
CAAVVVSATREGGGSMDVW